MKKLLLTAVVLSVIFAGCNDFLVPYGTGGRKVDRSTRGSIDVEKYVDFTVRENDAQYVSRQELLDTLTNRTYKNGNSFIKINKTEGMIEIGTDSGFYNGKKNVQMYAKFPFDIQAASSDCLYIRKDPKNEGVLMVDDFNFNGVQIPDILVCLPLYGYSRNRIEVSNVMDGFIIMPSGTYWRE